MLKTAVLAPMPSPMVRITMVADTGARTSDRTASPSSLPHCFTIPPSIRVRGYLRPRHRSIRTRADVFTASANSQRNVRTVAPRSSNRSA